MATRVGQAVGPVAFGPVPRRRDRQAGSGAHHAQRNNAVPPKKTFKAATPSAAKNSGRVPLFTKSASSSPPLGHYAGPKFSEPPSPAALPRPPVHWMSCGALQAASPEVCLEMTNQLKTLLKIKTRRLSGISPRTVAGDTVHRIAWRRAVLLCFF
ncbi:proline-rich nuclear receptor coactivator 2 A-like [Rhipicephalus sanguineus]|uniref:proline-rich nuclear receptor coactivator 2 A-like n=1 Tax=Rhipicephalus sanguineus TaxID=34632 RepID=UPI0020C495F0|nr:proline-rich nuclear receptor coactivator 2 A-like [Rhipicephalus sanguineus]